MTAALATAAPTAAPTGTPQPVALRAMPRREPPFDDERELLASVTRLDRHLPFDAAPGRPSAWQTRTSRTRGLPEPAIWTRRLLVGLVETAGGRRPLQQLAGFFSPSVHRGIGMQLERAYADGAPHWLHGAAVRSVRASEPSDDVVEVSAVLDTGIRVRAVAMRIEQWRGHWRCTRLQLG